jgi:hypothetical protein
MVIVSMGVMPFKAAHLSFMIGYSPFPINLFVIPEASISISILAQSRFKSVTTWPETTRTAFPLSSDTVNC